MLKIDSLSASDRQEGGVKGISDDSNIEGLAGLKLLAYAIM